MIKYLGSKRLIIPDILEIAEMYPNHSSVLDMFSGTSRVGVAFKKKGYKVIANDLATFSANIARCYIEADRKLTTETEKLIKHYNAFQAKLHGYFTETFCEKSRFFKPENGERIDFIREDLESRGFDVLQKSILLTSLMEAADRVDSTCGIQMAYLKQWAPRANNPLVLQTPVLLDSAHACEVHQADAKDLAGKVKADIVYLDPPYNQHSYWGNYHIWESLCLWDKAPVYGKACKREDTKLKKSSFNRKNEAFTELKSVVDKLDTKLIILSFSNEGFISREELEPYLATKGKLTVKTKDYKRYVGSQIGIYNPNGKKVGQVSHLRNEEYLYIVQVGE